MVIDRYQRLVEPSPFLFLEFAKAHLIGVAKVGFGDGDVVDQVVGRHADDREHPIFGSAKAIGLIAEERRQVVPGWRSHIGDLITGDGDRLDGSHFAAVAKQLVGQKRRRHNATARGAAHGLANNVAAELGDVALLGQSQLGDTRQKAVALKPAGDVIAKHRLLANQFGHHRIGWEKAKRRRFGVDKGIVHHLLDRSGDDEVALRGLDRSIRRQQFGAQIELAQQQSLQLLKRDGGVRDFYDRRIGAAVAKHIADTPDGKAEDQKGEQDLDYPRPYGTADCLKHGSSRLVLHCRFGPRRSRAAHDRDGPPPGQPGCLHAGLTLDWGLAIGHAP